MIGKRIIILEFNSQSIELLKRSIRGSISSGLVLLAPPARGPTARTHQLYFLPSLSRVYFPGSEVPQSARVAAGHLGFAAFKVMDVVTRSSGVTDGHRGGERHGLPNWDPILNFFSSVESVLLLLPKCLSSFVRSHVTSIENWLSPMRRIRIRRHSADYRFL